LLREVAPVRALVVSLLPTIASAGPVHVNGADAATLARELDGIGPAKVEAIVEYRQQNGPFRSAEDLLKVQGIGERVLEQNRGDIRLDKAGSTPAVALAHLVRILELQHDWPRAAAAHYYCEMAEAAIAECDFETAREHLRSARHEQRDFGCSAILRGDLARMQGDPRLALQLYRRVVRRGPGQARRLLSGPAVGAMPRESRTAEANEIRLPPPSAHPAQSSIGDVSAPIDVAVRAAEPPFGPIATVEISGALERNARANVAVDDVTGAMNLDVAATGEVTRHDVAIPSDVYPFVKQVAFDDRIVAAHRDRWRPGASDAERAAGDP
jgi:competence protein ComEA